MTIRLLLLGLLLTMAASAGADVQYYIHFELVKDSKTIEKGRAYVHEKPHTWSKGLKRSYLRLQCRQTEAGKIQKLYSTVDHFAGLRVTKQLAVDSIELTVVRDVVQPRLVEIRALAKSECKDLSPTVITTTETYSIHAKDGARESRPFGKDMTFKVTVKSMGESG